MPKTRAKFAKASETAEESIENKAAPQSDDPVKLLILPDDASKEAKICTIPHPRSSKPCQYFVCPTKGYYEFTRISPPKTARQSWLIARSHEPQTTVSSPDCRASDDQPLDGGPRDALDGDSSCPRSVADGYVARDPDLFVATPVDPLFLILSSLIASSSTKSPADRGVFLSADDILDHMCDSSRHFAESLEHASIKSKVEGRLAAVCDTVDAGDEKMYRLSNGKLLEEVVLKAKRLIAGGLPPSMEEKFVRKALERPVIAVKHQESSVSEIAAAPKQENMSCDVNSIDKTESQESTKSSLSSQQSTGTSITTPEEEISLGQTEAIRQSLRLRVALSYIISSYIPRSLDIELNSMLAADDSPIDFGPLQEELASIATMRSEALASRSWSDFSHKRGMNDDEAADLRAEKKAKKEEEEKKRKATETRGIRDLKKVDTSGMKKMSDFFGKKTTAAKIA